MKQVRRLKTSLVASLILCTVVTIKLVEARTAPPEVITKTQIKYEPVYLESEPVVIEPDVKAQSLGEFKITYYCSCKKCCGKTDGITASGAKVADSVTIAVDPSVIPLGSYVCIDGIGFRVAQDTGSGVKGKSIDVYLPSHSEALKKGVDNREVWLLEGK